MELPQDVLRIVKEYAAPLYPKYLAQYEEAMTTIGIGQWPVLKEKLKTRLAPKIVATILELKEAYLATNEKYDIMAKVIKERAMFHEIELARNEYKKANTSYFLVLEEAMFLMSCRRPFGYV